MTVLQLPDADLAGLEFLEALATPLWLLRGDGAVVWLNTSARAHLDLPATTPVSALRLGAAPEVALALAAASDGRRVETPLSFILDHDPPGGAGAIPAVAAKTLAEIEVRLSPAPGGSGLLLAEATADSAARQEVLRLTEQLVALSYAYPDMRFELRRDGTILDFAAASPGDLNVPAERFLSQRVQDVLPEPAATLVADALRRLAEGEPVVGLDFALPAPPESPGAGEKFFEARLVALMDGERVLCSMRNVTERVRAECEAKRAHDLLIDAIECVAEGFVLYDADDRLVLCNSRYRDLLSPNFDMIAPGTPFETVLRAGVAHGLYDIPADEVDDWLDQRIRQHRTAGPPQEVRLSNGRWIRLEEWRTKEGGIVGIRADVTDLKQREVDLRAARDEAEQANQRKSDYVHHLSHELRTPLNAVLGFAQIIRDEVMGPNNPRYRDYAGQVAAAGVYMLDLINNLLDLAKIEAGRMALNEESCSLPLLVELTFGMMQPRADERAVALVADIPDDLPGLRGDASLIRQMLTNLIGNAIKFSRAPGGRVFVQAGRDADGSLSLTVSDNGIGMRPEQIPMALDTFGQVHDREAAAEQGSGLGLPLTRALIALHGGSLAIDSAVGVGTTVRLTFPADRVEGTP